MRSSILARAGVVLTASALALSVGVGTASADDTQTARGVAVAPSTDGASSWGTSNQRAARAAGSTTLTSIYIKSGFLITKGYQGKDIRGDDAENYFPGTVKFADETGIEYVTAKVLDTANKSKGLAYLYPNGALLPAYSGTGKRRLSDITVHYQDATTQTFTTKSNYFYVRAAKDSKATYALSIKRVNSKISFTANGIKIFSPGAGTYKSLGSIKLQYLKDGSWRTKKTISLNKYGNGSYSYSTSSRYRYRIYSAQTVNTSEFRTEQSGRI